MLQRFVHVCTLSLNCGCPKNKMFAGGTAPGPPNFKKLKGFEPRLFFGRGRRPRPPIHSFGAAEGFFLFFNLPGAALPYVNFNFKLRTREPVFQGQDQASRAVATRFVKVLENGTFRAPLPNP